MKKIVSMVLLLSVVIVSSISTQAKEVKHYEEYTLYDIEVTAYCNSENLTSTGCEVREGIAAFAPEYYGYVACVYYDDEFLGFFEIKDTGSYESGVRTGEVLDIWLPTEEECKEFGRKECVFYLVKGVG